MPRAPDSLGKARHNPLYRDLASNGNTGKLSTKNRKKEGRKKSQTAEQSDFIDSKSSKKILNLAKLQQEEVEAEGAGDGSSELPRNLGKSNDSLSNPRITSVESDSDEEDDFSQFGDFGNGEEEEEELEIDEADRKLFEKFMPKNEENDAEPRQTLADIIMARIEEKEAKQQGTYEKDETAREPSLQSKLPPKVVEVYTKIGVLLSRYKSGKLPKAFKIIPSLQNWEDIVYLTRPDKWSPHACYEATRVFVSNLPPAQAQRFMNLVLLPKVRDDIAENKKLNYHLYMALKKGLYKPAAWFKGFLFPLVNSGCTLKEATIAASILTKVSVPVLHSAAALMRLSEMEPPSGPTSLCIRVLLNKKYALPFKVVDALVQHFVRWKHLQRPMAVLEHQSMLVFCQRYRNDLTDEQKEAILDVVREKGHYQIGAEVRRELAESVSRGQDVPGELDIEMN